MAASSVRRLAEPQQRALAEFVGLIDRCRYFAAEHTPLDVFRFVLRESKFEEHAEKLRQEFNKRKEYQRAKTEAFGQGCTDGAPPSDDDDVRDCVRTKPCHIPFSPKRN